MTSDDIPSPSERKTLTVRSGYTPREHPVHVEEHVINVPLSSSSSRRDAQADLIRTTIRTGDALTHQMLGRRKGSKRAGSDPFQKRGLQNAQKRGLDKKDKTVKQKKRIQEAKAPKMEINPLGAYALGAYPSQYIQPAASVWTPSESYSGLSIPQVMPMMNIDPEPQKKKPLKADKKKAVKTKQKEAVVKKTKSEKKSSSASSEFKRSRRTAAKPAAQQSAAAIPAEWTSAEPALPNEEIRAEFNAWTASIDSEEAFTKTLKGEFLVIENDISCSPDFEPGWIEGLEAPVERRRDFSSASSASGESAEDVVKNKEQDSAAERSVRGQKQAKTGRTRRTGYHLTAGRVRAKGAKKKTVPEARIQDSSAVEQQASETKSEEAAEQAAEAIGDSGKVSKRRRRTKYGLLRGNKGNNKKSGAVRAPSSNE